jgi:HD-like signal output (HDOD) protein
MKTQLLHPNGDAVEDMTGPRILDTLTVKLIDNDLPILRKTAARIVTLASTTRSDIGLIAQIILQDQPFTARVLRMANSAYYGRPVKGKVTSVTRAIMLLGFSTIRDMAVAAEYADFAQSRIPLSIDIQRLIAKAFLTAKQAVLLARTLGLPNADEIFIRSLFHSIGELTMAYYLPQVYTEIQHRMVSTPQTYEEAHLAVVGIPCQDITKALTLRYGIPSQLVRSSPFPTDPSGWTEEDRRDFTIKIAGDLSDSLFAPASEQNDVHFDAIASKCAQALDLRASAVTATVKTAFHQARDLGDLLNLDPSKFELSTAGDESTAVTSREDLVRACNVNVKVIGLPDAPGTTGDREEAPLPAQSAPPTPQEPMMGPPVQQVPPFAPEDDAVADAAADAPVAPAESVPPYLPFLMELSTHVLDKPDFNTIVTYLLEGLHRGCGFSHVFLLIPNLSTKTLMARFGVGPSVDDRLPTFTSPADAETNLLMRVMLQRTPVRLNVSEPQEVPLPPTLADSCGAPGVALGPLYSGSRSIGLIWADHEQEVGASMWSAFQLFILQANVALARLAR